MIENIENLPEKPPLAVIAGPTASGKSARALALAKSRNGVIINADASQLYRDLRLLSARPDREEEAQAPHRLYGVLDAAQSCSAASWADMAKREIMTAHESGRLPILVGGTGLYLNTLLRGLAPVPDIEAAVRAEVRELSTAALASALSREDEKMAARLRPSDTQRLARALEVMRSTGTSLADWQQRRQGGIAGSVRLTVEIVDRPREELYARCDARFDAMLAGGALEEVRTLMGRGLSADLPAMKAIGVPPLAAHLAGQTTLAEAAEVAKRDTRRYAKRQQTWFRTQMRWAEPALGAGLTQA